MAGSLFVTRIKKQKKRKGQRNKNKMGHSCVLLLGWGGWGGWALHGVKGLRFDEADINHLSLYTIHLMLCRVYFRCNNTNGIDSIKNVLCVFLM